MPALVLDIEMSRLNTVSKDLLKVLQKYNCKQEEGIEILVYLLGQHIGWSKQPKLVREKIESQMQGIFNDLLAPKVVSSRS
jgi:hypothetical protein